MGFLAFSTPALTSLLRCAEGEGFEPPRALAPVPHLGHLHQLGMPYPI